MTDSDEEAYYNNAMQAKHDRLEKLKEMKIGDLFVYIFCASFKEQMFKYSFYLWSLLTVEQIPKLKQRKKKADSNKENIERRVMPSRAVKLTEKGNPSKEI